MLDGTDSHEPAKSFLNCQTSIIICQNYGFQEVNKSIKSKRRKTWDNAIKEFIKKIILMKINLVKGLNFI